MGDKTVIGWVNRQLPDGSIISGHTFNPWWGCLKVSEECTHCYALDIASQGPTRYPEPLWGPAATTGRRLFGENHWAEPLKWNRQAERDGHRHSVFCASMADVYEEHPQLEPERIKLWKLIETTPMLNWLLLTKRPENIMDMSPWGPYARPWPDNVWIGTSAGLQKRADERIPILLEIPAAVKFISAEPLLGPVDFTPWLPRLSWIIAGGESGAQYRPLNLTWARSLRDQCQQSATPFYFKQVGGRTHAAGGRLLDGREWTEMPPEVPARGEPQLWQ
jgi:protein gp37